MPDAGRVDDEAVAALADALLFVEGLGRSISTTVTAAHAEKLPKARDLLRELDDEGWTLQRRT